MTYRNDFEALQARKVALDAAVDHATRERDATAQLLAEARARTHLPVLPNIRIASPCTESWEGMTGDERVRHCAKCDKDVFNLSALTAEQAESLIRERAGTLCARYYQRKDGTILLADCEIGRRGKRQRRYIAAGLALALSSGTAAAAVATHEEQRHDPDLEVIQGGVGGEPTTVLLPTQPRHWTETGIAECDAYGDAIYDYFWCDAVPSETAAVLMDSFRHAETAWKLLPDGERAAVAESCEKAKEKVEAQATEDGCTLGSGQSLELR